MTPEISVRPAALEDLDPIVELYNHYVEHTASTFEVEPVRSSSRRTWFEEHSAGGRHRLFVAVDAAGSLLGWASTSPFRPRAGYATTVESSVYCRPDALGRGIGRALYDALFRSIAQEDLERIVAGVALPNPASVALHGRFGFRHVGTFTRIGRKFGEFWDVAWFERPLLLDSERPRHV